MFIVGGIVAQFGGVAALRQAQRQGSWMLCIFAMTLLLGSAWSMSFALGVELGLAWALATISIAAYALVLFPFVTACEVGHGRVPRTDRRSPAAPSGSKARLALRLISAGPLYLIAALGLSLLIATKPWTTELTRLYIGGLSSPLFWSVGALHATVDPDLRRIVWLPVLIASVTLGSFYLL